MYFNNIKEISIKEFLSAIGVAPRVEKPHYGMYISPIRAEQNASFRVDYYKNVWYDHGIGVGGSIIDLVMHLEKCDFRGAVAYLKNRNFHKTLPIHIPNFQAPPPNSGIKITAVLPIQSQGLLYYLEKRGIPLYIAQKYCREIRYTVNGSKQFYAIGFLNDGGGWELRSAYFKGCSSPKTITTLETGHYRCLVFEGFFDFLSWYRMQRELPVPDNIVILNSVTNIKKAVDFIKRFEVVYSFMDNDEAGRNATKFLKSFYPNIIDHSYFYEESKDVNEQLQKYDKEIAGFEEETKRQILSNILAGLLQKHDAK